MTVKNSVIINKATESDLPEVLAIEINSFPMPFSEKLFRTELHLSIANFYVTKAGGKIVGYIDYWRVEDEVHVITVAVHPDKREEGIGSELIQWMIKDSDQHKSKSISLDVRVSNKAATHLYKKFGFEVVGLRKNYYQDNNEDALIMNLVL